MYLPTKAQEKQRPLNPALLHHLAAVEMGEQHIKYRKVPAPKPKFHLPPPSGLSMDSTWLPEVSGDNPDTLDNEVWNKLYIQVGEGAGGSSCYPVKHTPREVRSEAGGKTQSNTQERWFNNLLLAVLLKTHSFHQNLSPENTHQISPSISEGLTDMRSSIHSRPMDPRFKPCPYHQAKRGLGAVLLLNSLSMSGLATNHVPGPSWPSRTWHGLS